MASPSSMTRRAFSAIRMLALAAAGALVATTALGQPQPAAADPTTQTLSVVLLGDSYAAGNGTGEEGAGDYYGPAGSYRSHANWAHSYVGWLNDQGVHTTLVNLAHSGRTARDVVSLDIVDVPVDADLVLLAIGGNDVGFAAVVTRCLAPGFRTAAGCLSALSAATAAITEAIDRTEAVLQALQDRLEPDSEVVLLGYPRLSVDLDYLLGTCTGPASEPCATWESVDTAQSARSAGQAFDDAQQALVTRWNLGSTAGPIGQAGARLAVTYVPVADAFAGHEPDPRPDVVNPVRWVNEFFETRGRLGPEGTTLADDTQDLAVPYHPNLLGHAAYAQALIDRIGLPRTIHQVTGGAPQAWIQGPYVARTGVTLTLDARGSYGVGGLALYEWDVDGDGTFDATSTEPWLTHTYDAALEAEVGLRVTDVQGQTAEATTLVQITDDGDGTPREVDNCPDVANHGQGDALESGRGDLCNPLIGLYPRVDSARVFEVVDGVWPAGITPPPSPSASPTPTPDPGDGGGDSPNFAAVLSFIVTVLAAIIQMLLRLIHRIF